MQESIKKHLEEWKNKHTETNNTITEFKNAQPRLDAWHKCLDLVH